MVALFGGSQGFFEGFSNSLCILRGDDDVSIGEAACQHKGLTWEEPRVKAANPRDGVPDARWGHSAVAWRGKLVLFGGSNTQHCFNDTWVLDISDEPERGEERSRLVATWTKLELGDDVRPPSRAGQTVSLVGESLFVFGGCHISDVFNDLWTLDLSQPKPKWRELRVSGTPPHRGLDTPPSRSAIASSFRVVAGHPPWARAGRTPRRTRVWRRCRG